MKKNKQGLRDLNISNTNNRREDLPDKCSHDWEVFETRKMGTKKIDTSDVRHKCLKCDEISVGRFLSKDFQYGEL